MKNHDHNYTFHLNWYKFHLTKNPKFLNCTIPRTQLLFLLTVPLLLTVNTLRLLLAVENGGNAAKAGLKAGDQVLYTSSFFGDELWPADKLGFTKTAIQAKPDSVYFVVSRGVEVDVKRLPKRPAPPAFGRKLTDAQKIRFRK